VIIEHARVTVKDGQGAAFENAIAQAVATVFPRAQGYLGLVLHRCIEEQESYICAIEWRALEDHTVGFREGPLFAEWRALVGPFFADTPVVRHYEIVARD
jgi:heme-degrading monooxygenase HmoA